MNKTLAHGDSDIGVQDVLNQIAETILQIVLFQVEAKVTALK